MAIVLPHVFQDNVSESASGVQVNENFNVLKAAIEALQALTFGPASGTTKRAGIGENVTWEDTPSASHATFVQLMVEKNGGTETMSLTVTVGGQQQPQQARLSAQANEKMVYSFIVPAGVLFKANAVGATGGVSIYTSYTPLPF